MNQVLKVLKEVKDPEVKQALLVHLETKGKLVLLASQDILAALVRRGIKANKVVMVYLVQKVKG